MKEFAFKSAELWLYPGEAGNWHFVSLPKKESAEIKKSFGDRSKGWGSLPVLVTIGRTSWKTSIFPDKKSDGYLLPIKAIVRKKECLQAGEKISFSIKI